MKQRNIMAVVLFSIITLGIYDLFWLAKTKKSLNESTDVHTPTMWLLFAPYLFLVVGLIVVIALAGGSSNSTSTTGSTSSFNIGLVLFELFAFLLIIPTTFYWFFKFSKAVNHFTHGEMNTAMTFILLWLLRFIGLAIIQDKFNEMLQGPTASAGVPPFTGAPAGQAPQAPGAFGVPPQVPQQFLPPQPPVAPTMDNPWPSQPEQPPMPQAPQPPVVTPTAPGQQPGDGQPPQPPVPPVVQ